MENNILKLDLDLETYAEVEEDLIEKIKFISYLDIIRLDFIDKIEIIQKSKYSCKIYLKRQTTAINLLMLQMILENDFKRKAICYRDLVMENMASWNKLFCIKKYEDGTFKKALKFDVTKRILELVKLKK